MGADGQIGRLCPRTCNDQTRDILLIGKLEAEMLRIVVDGFHLVQDQAYQFVLVLEMSVCLATQHDTRCTRLYVREAPMYATTDGLRKPGFTEAHFDSKTFRCALCESAPFMLRVASMSNLRDVDLARQTKSNVESASYGFDDVSASLRIWPVTQLTYNLFMVPERSLHLTVPTSEPGS